MMTDVDVLVAHQRMTIRACGCGWDDLGRSHAEHVAAALDSARALRGEVVVRLVDVEYAVGYVADGNYAHSDTDRAHIFRLREAIATAAFATDDGTNP